MGEFFLGMRKRIAVGAVFASALLVWLGLTYLHYESYWHGTMYRVQTVDLNLLHHTLPPTLSQLIVSGRDEEIQKVLDSTYGLLGLIVTNPDGTAVLYNTSKSYNRGGVQSLGAPEFLNRSTEPYDLLTDPPPAEAVYEHRSPRTPEPDRVGATPEGQVLGRVYYVRSVAPPFLTDLAGLFTAGAALPGAKRGYAYISVMVVAFTLAIVLLYLWRRRELARQRQELAGIEADLAVRRRALEQLSQELVAQRARKEWLERESDLAYRRALMLKEALTRLRDSMRVDCSPGDGQISPRPLQLRPAFHPPSSLLTEIEALIPELEHSTRDLRGQAEQLHEQCAAMERRHAEMKSVVEQVSACASATLGRVVQFRAVR